jgi:carboxypeptidase C (cathepsin A)
MPGARLPPDASVRQTTTVDGRVLRYTATQGSLPIRDTKGMVIAEVTYTAYTLDGAPPQNRPVTFAMNGGPGAPAVYLNLGAIGRCVRACPRGTVVARIVELRVAGCWIRAHCF